MQSGSEYPMPIRPARGRLLRFLVVVGLALGIAIFSGGTGTKPVSAGIAGALSVNLTASPQNAATGQAVSFSYSASAPAVAPPFPSIVSATISFGDGTSANVGGGFGGSVSGTTTHVYTSGGFYTASFTASDSLGDSNSTTASVQVASSQPPVVSVSVPFASVTAGQPVTISYSVSSGIGIGFPSIGSVLISFGDGSSPLPLNGTNSSIQHTYASPGSYNVVVTATSGGQQGVGNATVTVASAAFPPVVTLTASPQQVPAGQSVNFVGSVVSATPGATTTSATILFGDGQSQAPQFTGAGFIAQHVYSSPGTYTATLSVSDTTGQTGQTSATISVVQPTISGQPPANVQIVNAATTGTVGQSVSFLAATATAQNTGASIASYSWSWGDGGTGVGQTASHVYSAAGTYTVTLTVTDTTGASANASSSITIASPLPPGITVNLPTGWNLVGGPNGAIVTGNSGPLYTFQAGDAAYEVIQSGTPLRAGFGYWAYLPTGGTITLPTANPQVVNTALPASQNIMIGNPGNSTATVSGSDSVVIFDPVANKYVPTTTLAPGQGAWATSSGGGTATITNSR